MKRYEGKGVYGAIAVGRIFLFRRREAAVGRVHVADTEAEKGRFAEARARSIEQLRGIYEKALKEMGEADARVFEIHIMMTEDSAYNESVENMIETLQVNAEYAVAAAADNFAARFSGMDDAYMRARAADIRDISNRIIRNLSVGSAEESACPEKKARPEREDCLEKEACRKKRDSLDKGLCPDQKGCPEKMIVCADDLAPSETVLLDRDRVLAFVTAHGSANSHTAILARSMSIPAVVGVGDEFLAQAADGMNAIVDGFTGEIYVEPDRETCARLEKKQAENIRERELLLALKGKENMTLDGTRVDICANIGGADDIGEVLLNDAGGIGLFRSEFLYLENSDYPTEEQQFQAYKRVLEGMGGKRVIIRTLDIGADKQVGYFDLEKEENPALGCRAIRICLTRPEIFRVQLRALYRASVYGRLGIMFPMITSVTEVEEIKRICGEVKAQLKAEGTAYSERVELGIMIETPAAAVISDRLAPMVDFFSVGTNDLTQYTLACDRQNPRLDSFCDTHHEAVLRLIEMSAENAHKNGVWIGICGELAADTDLTETFLRMGIDELSVSPGLVLKVRDAVRNIDLSGKYRPKDQCPEDL